MIAGWGHTAETMNGLSDALASGSDVSAVSIHDLAVNGNSPSPTNNPLQFSGVRRAIEPPLSVSRRIVAAVRANGNPRFCRTASIRQPTDCSDRSLERQSCRRDKLTDGMSSYAEGLLSLIEEKGGSSMVIGWSLGGLVALETACNWPERVSRLVLVSATPRFCSGEGYSFGIPVQNIRAMNLGLKREFHKTMTGFYRLAAEPFKEPLPAIRDQWNQVSGWIDELAGGLHYLMNTDLREDLHRIHSPVLMLHGREDHVIPWQAAATASRALPDSRLCLYDAVGHDLPLREPERLAEDIRGFLS